MARPSNPLRTQCEEFVRAELERAGLAALDVGSIVKRFVALGASRTRVHTWVSDVRQAFETDGGKPAAERAAEALRSFVAEEAQRATTMEAAKETAAVLDSLPKPAELAAEAVAAGVHGAAGAVPPPSAPAGVALVPDAARGVLAHLDTVIGTCSNVLALSYGPDGKMRNARMALASADMLRRTLETALKLYESINNVQQIESFMRETLAEVRTLSPETARAVVERMRAVQTRWSH